MADFFLWPVDDGEPPTATEVRTALARLSEFKVSDNHPEIGATWHLDIVNRNMTELDAYISIQFEGDDAGHNICFESGHELAIALVSAAIATVCGPMTLEHPSSLEPWLTLMPRMSYDEVVALVENAPVA